ncbi:MAG: CHASE domain-containing protein, partial [Bacteroidota bacterium]
MASAKNRIIYFLTSATHGNGWKGLVIFLAGLFLTAVAACYTEHAVEEKALHEYELNCIEIKSKISVRLHAYAQLLRSSSGLFAASDTVTRSKWKSFSEPSEISRNLPGIQGVGFALIIPRNRLQQHILGIRKEGFPEYTVKPVGDREVYTSIIYLEPFSGRNLRAFGYDMFSEQVRRRAMELSRDSDLATLSGKVQLVQETYNDVQ